MRGKIEQHNKLRELFESRPMWTRPAILLLTGLDNNLLKILLAKYAFYIASGPWGRLWCRFGYDPRIDSNSKQFQTIMVSFRLHKIIPERHRLKVTAGDRKNLTTRSFGDVEPKTVADDEYKYISGQMPVARQMWYCVCDVQLPVAQKILRSDFLGMLKTVHSSHGWLPPEVTNSIRKAIKDDVSKMTTQQDDGDDELIEQVEEVLDDGDEESDDWEEL